jgi:hypothetical protein
MQEESITLTKRERNKIAVAKYRFRMHREHPEIQVAWLCPETP